MTAANTGSLDEGASPSSILIRGGRVLDPSAGIDEIADVLIRDGRIAEIRAGIQGPADRVLDATGFLVTPGLVDIHVHLREPGQEGKETIRTGSLAAVAGGFTTVCAMPNTEPPLDTRAGCAFVVDKALGADAARVLPIGCVSKGRRGEEIADLSDLVAGGACAFSDDGDTVKSAALMHLAIARARDLDRVVIDHAEEPSMTLTGQMHEGRVSAELGLEGKPGVAEDIIVARNILIAEALGARVHIAHISTARSIELVREAKRRGVRVTCEVCPHHLVLTDEACRDLDPARHKMSPPLRPEADRQAALAGIRDGTIDAIASDHAPHTCAEKGRGWSLAPNGVIGLETTLPVVITDLVETGELTLARAVELLTIGPVRCLGLDREGQLPCSTGTLARGALADVTVIDTRSTYVLGGGGYRSRSVNSPFTGREVRGSARWVLVGGRVAFDAERDRRAS